MPGTQPQRHVPVSTVPRTVNLTVPVLKLRISGITAISSTASTSIVPAASKGSATAPGTTTTPSSSAGGSISATLPPINVSPIAGRSSRHASTVSVGSYSSLSTHRGGRKRSMDSTTSFVDANASTVYGGSPPRRRVSRSPSQSAHSPSRFRTHSERSPTRSPTPARSHKHHGRGKSSTRTRDPATTGSGGPSTSAATGTSSFPFGGSTSTVR